MPLKKDRSGLKQKPLKAKAEKINREALEKPLPTAQVRQRVSLPIGKVKKALKTQWPPLQNPWRLAPTENIRRGMLPEVIENVAFEYAERAGLNCDALAMSMMTAISSVIPTNIKVAAYDDVDNTFVESMRIWVAKVGPDGSGKSGIRKAVIRPIEDIDDQHSADHIRELTEYSKLSKREQRSTDKPVRKRAILPGVLNELTAQMLADNPDGILGAFGELSDFLVGGSQMTRSLWSAAYDTARFTSTRISRGDCVPSCSILGAIQPSVLADLLSDASNNALAQRFIPIIMPDTIAAPHLREAMFSLTIYNDLVKDIYANCPLRGSGAVLHFSPKAALVRDKMFHWVDDYVAKERARNGLLSSHVSQFKALFVRLCGLFHMIVNYRHRQARAISAETANKVHNLMTSFQLKHAETLYNTIIENTETSTMKHIAEYILAHGLERVNARDMQRGSAHLRKFTTREMAIAAECMVSLGWLRPSVAKRVDSLGWEINPAVHKVFADKWRRYREERTSRESQTG